MIEVRIERDGYHLMSGGEEVICLDKMLYRRYLREIKACKSEAELKSYLTEKEPTIALGFVYRLLAQRGYISLQLEAKLKGRGISHAVIEGTLAKVKEQGYLNDERELELFVKRKIENGEGPYLIQSRLVKLKMANPAAAAEWISRLYGEETELKQIKGWLERKGSSSKEKLFRFLKGKGFHEGLIRKILL